MAVINATDFTFATQSVRERAFIQYLDDLIDFLFPFCNCYMLQRLFNVALYSLAYLELLTLWGETENLFHLV